MPTFLMMIGGTQFLMLTGLFGSGSSLGITIMIGAISGYFFRDKNGKLTGVILGIVGAFLITLLLSHLVLEGMLFMPAYVILGAWLFNFTSSNISK